MIDNKEVFTYLIFPKKIKEKLGQRDVISEMMAD
jgi:hypothetical protein